MNLISADVMSNTHNRERDDRPAGTLAALIDRQARRTPDRACLLSADGNALTWGQLNDQIGRTRQALRQRGFGPDDRIAMVMPNGPLLAVAFIAVAAGVACAPLNPSYGVEEFAFFLDDLKAKALIVTGNPVPAAIEAARQHAIPVLEAVPHDGGSGLFALEGDGRSVVAADQETGPEHVALLLHTSGTTSRPKLVPLRHRNLLASAYNIVRTLALTADDCCLNLMPLFHIHGLVGGLLAPLAGRGSALCPPSFRPDVFCAWFATAQPTWFTAVPTMHRAIVAAAQRSALARGRLRFIRSSSAPLPISLFEELGHTFGVPVVEAYSMTEAAHQMTCNPIAPGLQKPGTVGVPAGPEVAILDAQGRVLPREAIGEIAIRGPSVIDGYAANPEANAQAYVDGWFRTGDQGRFDADGYLVLTGRLKEQVNRGGEKISPLEIDQALMRHPDVMEAIAFGYPHATLGEEIAAAVVLRPDAPVRAEDLQTFLQPSLAPFKLPRRIMIMDQIPKGPTGKHQRRQMAALLGLEGPRKSSAPTTEAAPGLETALLALWRAILDCPTLGVEDDFFDHGGDSLRALEVLVAVEAQTACTLPESTLLDHPTVREFVRALTTPEPQPDLIQLNPRGKRAPLFFFHGDYEGGYYTRGIADLLGADQPFYVVAPHDAASGLASIEAMARDRLPHLLAAQPDGPFRLAGYCNGGMVALEVARQLLVGGRAVAFVALIDTPPLNFHPIARRLVRALGPADPAALGGWLRGFAADAVWRQANNMRQKSLATYFTDLALGVGRWARAKLPGRLPDGNEERSNRRRLRHRVAQRELVQSRLYNRLFRQYVPDPVDVPMIYYSATYRTGMLRHLGPAAELVPVPGGHWGCVTSEAHVLAADLSRRLAQPG